MSLVEKWIRKEVNINKLSTSRVATSADMPIIKINYLNDTLYKAKYDSARSYDDAIVITVSQRDDYKIDNFFNVPFHFKGTIALYRCLGECEDPESLLDNSEYIRDVDISFYGTGNRPHLVVDGRMIKLDSGESELDEVVRFLFYHKCDFLGLGDMEREQEFPFVFVGKSNLIKCDIVASISMNGSDTDTNTFATKQ